MGEHPIARVFQSVTIPSGVTALADVEALPGEQRGDCLRAAVASLFDMTAEDVPHFVSYDDWWGQLETFMACRNLAITWVPGGPTIWNSPYMATGKSPRGDFKHVVIERNGQMIHDPHPSGVGLDGDREGVYILTPIDHRELPVQEDEGECPCGDIGWIKDKNWQPEFPRQGRRRWNGLIPCGFCNEDAERA